MAGWILVPCLVSLRNEFNVLAPDRDKSSDGSIGDTAHASSSSDHNPDETGATPSEDADNVNEVHAIDVDVDLRKSGWTMDKAVEIIVTRHRNGQDDRLQNVIYNRRIWSRSWGWTAREYTGKNPHDHHAHFSSRYTTEQESNTKPWGLLAVVEKMEEDMPLTSKDIDLFLGTDLGKPGGGDTVGVALQSSYSNSVAIREMLTKLVVDEATRAAADLTRDTAILAAVQKVGAFTGKLSDAQFGELLKSIDQAVEEVSEAAMSAANEKITKVVNALAKAGEELAKTDDVAPTPPNG